MDVEILKQKILNLAIRGKLVPQDPNDEPASVLIEKIKKEKNRLIKEGQIKANKEESYIYRGSDNCYYEKIGNTTINITEEIPFEIPNSWTWVRLKNICSKIVDGDHNPPSGLKSKTDFLMISAINIDNDNICNLNRVRYLSEESFIIENNRTKLQKGDILLTIVGTMGRSCIYNGDYNLCFQRSVSVISTLINNKYLKAVFDSQYIQKHMEFKSTGTAQKGFYLNQVEMLLIPIPPLHEQQIIADIIDIFNKQFKFLKNQYEDLNQLILIAKNKILENIFGENSSYKSYYKLKPIHKYIKLISGRDLKTSDFNNVEKGIPYITGASNFINNDIKINRWTEKPQVISNINDILITCKGTIGKISINKIGECHIARQIMAIKPNEKIEIKYLEYFLESKVSFLINKSSSLIPGITREDILSLQIPIFDIRIQRDIVNKIDGYFQIIDTIIS